MFEDFIFNSNEILTARVVGLPPEGRFCGRPRGIVTTRSEKFRNSIFYKFNLFCTKSDIEETSGSEVLVKEITVKLRSSSRSMYER